MKEQLITFETAILAKKKKFPMIYSTPNRVYDYGQVKTNAFSNYSAYDHGDRFYPAPTQSLLQKWLREIHMIRVYPTHGANGTFNYEIYLWDNPNDIGKWSRVGNISSVNSYEEALERGLQEALKMITL